MAVRTKGRRKITVDSEQFIWYVDENYDYSGYVLHVISHDKKMIVMYPLYDQLIQKYIVVLGEQFEGAETGGSWQRFVCPSFDSNGIVTPKHVADLIAWCLNSQIKRTEYSSSWPIL